MKLPSTWSKPNPISISPFNPLYVDPNIFMSISWQNAKIEFNPLFDLLMPSLLHWNKTGTKCCP